ncbi:MAG: hypothetical protein MRZ79_25625 [Bacteroidia bacterium]|nr:hypothetical protein [Bacteroidia bacterium]
MKLLAKKRFIFLGALTLIHLLVFIWQLNHQNWLLVDSKEYIFAAQNMAEDGSWYSKDKAETYDPGHHTRRTPLYPFILLLGYLFTKSPAFVAIWQIGLSIFNCTLLLRLIKQFHGKESWMTYILVFAFLILMPSQFIYANLIMTEILFQCFLSLGIWLLVMAHEEEKNKWYWGISLLLILAMATKPVMYLFFLPFLVLMIFQAFNVKNLMLVLIGLLPLVFVLSYQGINLKKTGYFHYSSVQSLNLLQLTALNLLINRVGEDEAVRITDDIHERALAAPSFAEGQKLMQAECMAIMWKYRGFYVSYHLRGMVNFFLDPGRFDLYHILGIQEVGGGPGLSRAFSEGGYAGVINYLSKQPIAMLLFLGLVFIANILRLLGFIGFVFMKNVPLYLRFSMVILIGYLAAVTGPYGASRFSLPINLLLIFAASVFYLRRLSSKKKFPIK